MAMSFRDAFKKGDKKQFVIKQALQYQQDISNRIKELESLVYETFVNKAGAEFPEDHRSHKEVFDMARGRIRILARNGGVEYTHAITRVKAAWESREAFRDAVDAVVPLAYCPKHTSKGR